MGESGCPSESVGMPPLRRFNSATRITQVWHMVSPRHLTAGPLDHVMHACTCMHACAQVQHCSHTLQNFAPEIVMHVVTDRSISTIYKS